MKIKQEKIKIGSHKKQPAKAKSNKWFFLLYIAGQTPKAITAFNNLKLICEEKLKGKYHIKVVDILNNPRLARSEQILAIPTLVRNVPLPVRNIIGDLSNSQQVLIGLDLAFNNM